MLAAGCADDRTTLGDSGDGGDSTATTSVASADDGDGDGDGDGSGDTGANELPEVECETTVESELPGVTIEIGSDCAYFVSDAQAGVDTPYTIAIAQPLEAVDSGNMCWETPPGGIHVEWRVTGNGHTHCHCDVGLCPDYTPMPTTLVVGETMRQFSWVAFDWDGPSDYDVPYGDAFEPGEYEITVEATGTWVDPDGATVPFSVRATRPMLLVQG
jgi:hypothetical protein